MPRACTPGPRAPFIGATVTIGADSPTQPERNPNQDGPAIGETCDYCGSAARSWRKCKLICDNCKQINKSCADL